MSTSPQRWYRGNMHMHSYWSDGHQFPELAAAYFKAAGYDFIAWTEHDQFQVGERWVPLDRPGPDGQPLGEGAWFAAYRAMWPVECAMRDGVEQVRLRPLSEYRGQLETPDEFLMICGEEVSTKSGVTNHWINVYNAPHPLGPLSVEGDIAAAIEAVLAQAARLEAETGLVIHVSFNHPNYRYNAAAADLAAAPNLVCFEIHTALNSTMSYGDATHPGCEQIWDDVLARRLRSGGQIAYGLATDDCHNYLAAGGQLPDVRYGELPERAWVMVRAAALTPDEILRAVRQGDYFGSSGVLLEEVTSSNTDMALRIQAKPGVTYTTHFIGTRRDGSVGEVFSTETGLSPNYHFAGDELYVRAVVISDREHPNPTVPGDVEKAWVQPVKV